MDVYACMYVCIYRLSSNEVRYIAIIMTSVSHRLSLSLSLSLYLTWCCPSEKLLTPGSAKDLMVLLVKGGGELLYKKKGILSRERGDL